MNTIQNLRPYANFLPNSAAARRLLARGCVAAALALAAAGAHGQCAPLDATVELKPTKAALAVDATATAGLHVGADCSKLFGLNVVADLGDGRDLTVLITTVDGGTLVGAVTMFQSLGQLVMVSADGRPAALDSLAIEDVRRVQVYVNPNAGLITGPGVRPKPLQLLLDGTF